MNQVFSNGPSKDFVVNPFTTMVSESTEICVAAPYVTETADLLTAAKQGKSIKLLAGLNATTSPEALAAIHCEPNIAIRYFTHRFHAKIFIFDTAALVGSSNLTDGGLRSNREATILLSSSDDSEAIYELRALFAELWEFAPVLTTEKLKSFEAARLQFKPANADELIGNTVGKAEPPNIYVGSQTRRAERVFMEHLRRQVYEQYRPSFSEVTTLLQDNKLRRSELDDAGIENGTNRFLNWVRLTYASGDEAWHTVPLRSQEARRVEILRLGHEWASTDLQRIPDHHIDWLREVQRIFCKASAIDDATQEELTGALMSIHAFYAQRRFVKGGEADLPNTFWKANNHNLEKAKRTLKYLVHGSGDFVQRLHDVLYDPRIKLGYFGMFCALELYGTIKPEDFPPMNGRSAKALRFLGFDVRGA